MSEGLQTRYVLATGFLARMRGLLGTQANWGEGASILVLVPCKSVHTLGMGYALDIAFCDRNGTVLKSARNVQPGRMLSCCKAAFVLERPHASKATWPAPGDAFPLKLHYALTCECGRAQASRE